MAQKTLIEFEHESVKYHIVAPTQEQLLHMDMEYRKAFSKAVREGMMTEFEAKRTFEKNGTWTDEHEKEVTGLQMKIVALELDLEKTKDNKKGREIAFEIMGLRNKLMDLVNYKSRMMSTCTAEGYAETVKMAAFTYQCVMNEAGNLVFPNKKSFCEDADSALADKCFSHALLANMGMTAEDMELKLNEREWLEANGYLGDEGQFTQKYYDELITENEVVKKPEEKKEETPAKKKIKKAVKKQTRKRRTNKKVE